MSTAFLHVGQCGNQLGQAFWQETEEWNTISFKKTSKQTVSVNTSTAAASNTKPDTPTFSLLDGTLPCVLIDTEPKVIRKCVKSSGVISRKVPKEFLISEQAGRGNNWAYGYYGRRRRESKPLSHTLSYLGGDGSGTVVDQVKEQLRKLVEKCDRFGGTVLFHSIAGGTGSGLGSVLLEHLRQDYPLAYIISVAVAPFSFGETPLQHYNSLLCLSWLQTYSDAVLLFQNDSTLEQVQSLLYSGRAATGSNSNKGPGSVSMDDMNKHISKTICNCFLPVWDMKQRSPHMSGREPWELIRSICPDQATKFITPVHNHWTKPTTSWDQLLTRLMHSNSLQKKHTTSTSPSKVSTSSILLVSRSSPSNMESLVRKVSLYERKLKHILNTVEWNPFPVDYWFSYEPHLGERKASTILVNSTAVLDYFDSVYKRAGVMYREKAYVHWYEKYGCEKDTFKEAFETVRSMIQSYESL